MAKKVSSRRGAKKGRQARRPARRSGAQKTSSSSLGRSRSYSAWRTARYAAQKERKPHFRSLCFREVPECADRESVDKALSRDNLSFPGEFPFTRGIHPTMYRGRLWTMRQFAGYGSPEDTNRRFHYLLERGQTGLSTAFDMPALMGYDPDHPKSLGEVGREGVSLATIEDMERLFAGIDLAKVTVSMTINATATAAMAMYLAMARRRGIPFSALGGTIQNDMLKEFIAQKEWISPPPSAVRLTCDVIEYCAQEVPNFNPISVSGYHIREAGATAAQELAFTLADGLAYVQHLCERGVDVDSFAPRLSFFFDVHNDFFEEIAKFRAARRLWARLMRERFAPKNPRSLMLRTHAQTAGVSLTAQQPMNNVVRVSLQALAAVLGGVQSLHTNSMDETLSLPTEEAVKVALRTQQIIAEESGVADVVDPLGGSFYIEQLTGQIEREARTYITKIDEYGGMLAAVEEGYPQREISESAYQFQCALDRGELSIVGVNRYRDSEEQPIPTLSIDLSAEKLQRDRVVAFKRARDPHRCERARQQIQRACSQGRNVMPALIEAVDLGVTLGEISDIYREVFGVYRDPGTI